MSLSTKIRGYTAWVNLRLKTYDVLMNNVIMDILTGTNLKFLLDSYTKKIPKRLGTMDNLTKTQMQSRVEWTITELKKHEIIAPDIQINSQMFAMRSHEQIFDLLWRLLQHDAAFVYDRFDYLMLDQDDLLCKIVFRWIPDPPPKQKARKVVNMDDASSLLAGFGNTMAIQEMVDEPLPQYHKFPGSDLQKSYRRLKRAAPTAKVCLINMVNSILSRVEEGQMLTIDDLDDLGDHRVLCGIVNAFIPEMFTTEILLNDKWCIDLALQTIEKLVGIETDFSSQDMSQADTQSIVAYFTATLMHLLRMRQNFAAVRRNRELKRLMRKLKRDVDMKTDDKKTLLMEKKLAELQQERERLQEGFDLDYGENWYKETQKLKRRTRLNIKEKMKERFETVKIPRSISIRDISLALLINLNLTKGAGFYKMDKREKVGINRRIVAYKKNTKEFLEDFTGATKDNFDLRHYLGLPTDDVAEVDPANFPGYSLYLESGSSNKMMYPGQKLLYQVFPGNKQIYCQMLLKAIKDSDLLMVRKLVLFFPGNFINVRDPHSQSIPLHVACKAGDAAIVQFLLEEGANMDIRNMAGCTPFHSAMEGQHKLIGQMLIEWGADVLMKDTLGKTGFDLARSENVVSYLKRCHEYILKVVPEVIQGNTAKLADVVQKHFSGYHPLANLRVRCFSGSTPLHTACHWGCTAVVEKLLSERVDVNVQDYRRATPLHRASTVEICQILEDGGADINSRDADGNTPLHVKCYGEQGQESQIECIEFLLDKEATLTCRNKMGLMAIHCAAIQGRMDAMMTLLNFDMDAIKSRLEAEDRTHPELPSLANFAITHDHLDVAEWLLDLGIGFKDGELALLLHQVVTGDLNCVYPVDTMGFLLHHGAAINKPFDYGNTSLHLICENTSSADVLRLLLEHGGEIDVLNTQRETPLFFAARAGNMHAAAMLLDYGADVRCQDVHDRTALDYIYDYDEWIDCGMFDGEMVARLTAYSFKQCRQLVEDVSRKVKLKDKIRWGGFVMTK